MKDYWKTLKLSSNYPTIDLTKTFMNEKSIKNLMKSRRKKINVKLFSQSNENMRQTAKTFSH
jgi:lauroyl/myristoyl acyltransferase